jgi:hypothetical protein
MPGRPVRAHHMGVECCGATRKEAPGSHPPLAAARHAARPPLSQRHRRRRRSQLRTLSQPRSKVWSSASVRVNGREPLGVTVTRNCIPAPDPVPNGVRRGRNLVTAQGFQRLSRHTTHWSTTMYYRAHSAVELSPGRGAFYALYRRRNAPQSPRSQLTPTTCRCNRPSRPGGPGTPAFVLHPCPNGGPPRPAGRRSGRPAPASGSINGRTIERATGGSEAVRAARRGGEEYLLERGLFRRRSTGAVVQPGYLDFAFPPVASRR